MGVNTKSMAQAKEQANSVEAKIEATNAKIA